MDPIVVIPCYDRPAFLKCCLDYICQADRADEMKYLFCLDYGFDRRNLEVIKEFPFRHAIYKVKQHIQGIGKQSNNVLNGMTIAAAQCERFFYIEDDVFIGKDFFSFGMDMPDLFCCILSQNHNAQDNPQHNENGFYIKGNHDYQGIGSVYNSAAFNEFVKPHYNYKYILAPVKYCAENFPNTFFGKDFAEQDGLIRRVIEKHNLLVAFACVPRCFHAGFFGYHRLVAKDIQRLPLDAQCRAIKEVAFNIDRLRQIAPNEHLVYDSMPVDLSITHSECYEISL